MGKHSSQQPLSYWEARRRRKDLRARNKPPKKRRAATTKKRWFVLFFVIGVLIGGSLGVFYKPILKAGARIYLSVKQHQWQPQGKEKKAVEKALTRISSDPNKSVNTLVLGSDSGSNKGEGGWCRSDVMMLVCLQERDKKAVVISIPRDTRVSIPGSGVNKINAAHSLGGPPGTIDIVKQFLGIDVNHYISMNFDGFKKIIDAIGGVPIHLNKSINDPHAGYLPAGDLLLDGEQALVVVRSRKLPGGDIDRIKSQQAFLRALIDKAYTMRDVWKGKKLVDIIAATCKMDYSAADLEALANELRNFPINNVQFVSIPGDSKTIGGVSYFVANEQALGELMTEVRYNNQISPELIARLQQSQSQGSQSRVEQLYDPTADVITVLASGKGTSGAVPIVAQELRLLGHQKVFEGQAKQPGANTAIYHRAQAKDAAENLKKSIPEFANAQVELSDPITAQYNSPIVIVLGNGFATPGLLSIYGRVLQPAVQIENLGRKVKSFG